MGTIYAPIDPKKKYFERDANLDVTTQLGSLKLHYPHTGKRVQTIMEPTCKFQTTFETNYLGQPSKIKTKRDFKVA